MPQYTIINGVRINNVKELKKLAGFFYDENYDVAKINVAQVARDLGCSRTTVYRYLKDEHVKIKKKRFSKMDPYYDQVYDMLINSDYKYTNVAEFHEAVMKKLDLSVPYDTFKKWVNNREKLDEYFKNIKRRKRMKAMKAKFAKNS